MARSAAPDVPPIAPGSLLVSALVGIALAAAGFVVGIGATGFAEGTTSFWYLSRASGFVAYLLLWGSVVWGLLLSTGIGRTWTRPPQLLDAHQFLSTLSVGFAGFHGLVLMGDRYIRFPLRAVTADGGQGAAAVRIVMMPIHKIVETAKTAKAPYAARMPLLEGSRRRISAVRLANGLNALPLCRSRSLRPLH